MLDSVMQWFPGEGHFGANSSIVLSLVFFAASFVLIPRTLLCLGAGANFGLAATFSERIQTYVDARPRLRRIAAAVDEEGWRVVALLRFASPVPNAVQNYLFGLTRIGFWPFAVTTFIFSVPQIMLYVYLGSAGRAYCWIRVYRL